MRIGIDARFYGPLAKGLGRYTEKLIQYLQKSDQKNQYVIFLRQNNFDELKIVNKNFRKVIADYPWYTFTEQVKMPQAIARERVDIMHFPHFNVPIFYRGKFIVTIHDLILTKFPTERASTLGPFLYRIKHFTYKIVIRRAVRKAVKIITVSHHSKKEIMGNFKVSPEKIIVTYEATSDFKNTPPKIETSQFVQKTGLIKPYLLYVGNAYPHKNLERLLAVFKEIVAEKKTDLNLVLVGKMDYFFRRLKNLSNQLQLKNRVVFTGYVSDEELKFLYQNALFYIFPSMAEGFGLPPLEAMRQGLPVAASRGSCLPEVLGEAAYYFDPFRHDEIKRAILRLAFDEGLRKELRERGLAQVKKYSWPKLADETLKVYESIL